MPHDFPIISRADAVSRGACDDGLAQADDAFGPDWTTAPMHRAVRELDIAYAIWALRLLPKAFAVRFAVACARRVLPIFEVRIPGDLRPRKALEAADAWLANPTPGAADDAADAAAEAVEAAEAAEAADAAKAAAYAAADVAYAAADVAAAAADVAAEAAYAAAADAAEAAADADAAAAAYAAEAAAQRQILCDMFP